MEQYKIVFTAAGTGGHVVSALSTISKLKEMLPKQYHKSILFIGSDNLRYGQENVPSIEEKLVKKEGIDFIKIRSGKLQRIVNWGTFVRFFKLGAKIPLGFWDAFKLISKIRPQVTIGFGGYVTPSVIWASRLFGATTAIHEQTMVPGIANKVAAWFAHKVFVTYPNSVAGFWGIPAARVEHVGYPLRPDIQGEYDAKRVFALDQDKELLAYLERVRKDDVPFLVVVGGSIGSHVINLNISKLLPQLAERAYILVLTGDPGYYDDYSLLLNVKKSIAPQWRHRVFVATFLRSLPHIFKLADVVVARSGAGIVYELGMLKKLSVLVPLPFTRGNEQLKQARVLQKVGLAVVVEQEGLFHLNVTKLYQAIKDRLTLAQKYRTRKKTELITDKETYRKNFSGDGALKMAQWIVQQLD